MSTLSHPGELSPLPPGVTLDLAEDWEALPSGAALLSARGIERGEDPEPTLDVWVHLERPGHALGETLTAALRPDRDRGGFVEDPVFSVEFGGREWTAVNATWGPPHSPSVAVHLAAALDRGAVTQVVLVSGRAKGPRIESDYAALQRIIETVRLTEPGRD